MATASLGRLTLDLVAQIGQFTDPLDRAERKAKDSADKMSKSFRSFGDQLKDAFGGTQLGSSIDFLTTKLNSLQGGALVATGAISGMVVGGLALGTVGLAKMSIEAAKADVQLQVLANRANTSVKNFQILEQASLGFGVSQDQLGSILADVQEKLGEFSATKGGGGADFFDALKNNTKMTEAQIKSFSKTLQGKDGIGAIQAISNKLDDLDVSKQERRFIFESLASDLGNLAPLFAENGRLINDFGTALEDAGVIKTEEAIKKSQLLAAQTQAVNLQFQGWKNQLVTGFMPAIVDVANAIFGTSKNGIQLQEVGEGIGSVLRYVTKVALGASAVFVVTGKLIGGIAASIAAMKGEKLNTANIMFDDIQETLADYGARIESLDNSTNKSVKSNNNLVNSILAINSASNQTSSGLKTNTEDAKENEKATKKQTEAKLKLVQVQKEANRLIGISGNSGIGTGAHLDVRYGGSLSGRVSDEHLARLQAGGKSLASYRISSEYGPRKAPTAGASTFHKGVDFAMPKGTPITTNVSVKGVKTWYDSKGGGYVSEVTFADGVVLKLLHQSPDIQGKIKSGSSVGAAGLSAKNDDLIKLLQDRSDLVSKNDAELARSRLALHQKYLSELEKIEDENSKYIFEIKQAFTENDPSRQKYLDLQKLVYQKDLKEFEKTQEAKRIAAYNSLNDPIYAMRDKGVEAIANFAMTPMQKQQWQLNNEQQDGYSGLANDLGLARSAIEDNELLTSQQKYEQLENAYATYLQNKAHLDAQYDQQFKDLARSQQIEQVNMWGGILSTGQNTFSQLAQSAKDGLGEQSSTYRTMFAMQQAFSVASSMVAAWTAYTTAFADPSAMTLTQKFAGGAAVMAALMPALTTIASVSMQGFATGGHITGAGTGTSDDIPIWASNGEFMLRAAVVEKLGLANLNYMNATGEIPNKYATGGAITLEPPKVLNMQSSKMNEYREQAQQSQQSIPFHQTINNVVDWDEVPGVMAGVSGQKVTLNTISRNRTKIRQLLGV